MAVRDDIERVLFSEDEIEDGIRRVAFRIAECYGDEEFTVVSVLKGSCVFAADLIRRVSSPLRLAFVAASSYGGGTRPAALDIQYLSTPEEIHDRRLLLVDDIVDSGRTLSALRDELLRRGARDVRSCAFLDKPARRAVPFEVDFRCFEVDDLFVVGYGLDYAGRYRNLPMVAALKPAILEAARAKS